VSKGEPRYGWGESIEVSGWWYSVSCETAFGRGAERMPAGLRGEQDEGRAETETDLAGGRGLQGSRRLVLTGESEWEWYLVLWT
jgi:hypothetical protein